MRRKKKDLNTLSKPRLSSDSQSVTSFETGSENSGGPNHDTLQLLTPMEDRISTTGSLSRSNTLGMPSPKACSRKKSKKKTFFSKAFQRKNPVIETQLTVSGATLGEQLPTIRDEQNEQKGSQLSLSVFRDQEHSAFVKSFDASLLDSGNEFKEEKGESLLQRGRCHSVDDLENYSLIATDDSKTDGDQKRTKKVTRTTSFAAIRKNGFTAIAKEVEKRFRKKRRSKTADNSEILQAKEEYERIQKAGTSKEF